MKCPTSQLDYQPYPLTGQLFNALNLQLEALQKAVTPKQATVYCYVIATIENCDGCLVQRGSAPNFQGGMITLCTCKHYMRTFLDTRAWKGKWIAGFTGVRAGGGRNVLVYLMRVSHAFQSHRHFWFAEAIPAKTKRAKAAHLDKHGDIYMPLSEAGNLFDTRDYVPPREDHVHAENALWHRDIDYQGCSGRRAALLVGDPGQSFLWSRPMLFRPGILHRGQKKCELYTLLDQLQEVDTP